MADRPALLDPAFVRELEVLRRQLEVRARSGAAGERVARRRGASVEFEEHRAYAPGDDLRRIDWSAYARSGEPVLKVFRADEDAVVRLLCDTSASMRLGEPPKITIATRIAAALGYMALARGERTQLLAASDGLDGWRTPSRGRSGLPPLLRALDELEPDGRTDLVRAIESVVKRSPRPGMLVVSSDFFDPGPVLTALARASAAGHDVVLVHVLSTADVEPELEGDLAIEDVETGETIDVTIDGTAARAYREALNDLIEGLRRHARRYGATYVRAVGDTPLDEVIRAIVARGAD